MALGAGDTIVALSSGRPPAAIAVVRTSGPRACALAQQVAGSLPPARQATLRRLIDPSDGNIIDDALVIRFAGPHSATGEDVVEYQCHGGRATVDALIAVLVRESGVRLAEPGEFTRRALANGRLDLTEAEGLADLLAAETDLQRRSAMVRAGGGLRVRLDRWREQLLSLSARAEVAIDYADEEEGSLDDDLSGALRALSTEIRMLAESPRVEPLRDGIRVVLAGPPNAGKSSLLNALVQAERAIVTPIAGTTRDVIEVPVSISGIPFVLVDTAGLHESDDAVEAIGIARARQETLSADILLWLGPAEAAPVHERLIVLFPKSDLPRDDASNHGLPVSSHTGLGIPELSSELVVLALKLLPRGDEIALVRRERDLLADASDALARAASLTDPVLVAEELRVARSAIDRIAGRAGVEDLLDTLFGRFCLGK
jgi:tRNA modification GTPase